jgi:hypothetical protein
MLIAPVLCWEAVRRRGVVLRKCWSVVAAKTEVFCARQARVLAASRQAWIFSCSQAWVFTGQARILSQPWIVTSSTLPTATACCGMRTTMWVAGIEGARVLSLLQAWILALEAWVLMLL